MNDTTYQTRDLVAADAGTTVIIRKKSTGNDGELGYITVLKDTAHTIAFYDGETSAGDLLFTKPASMAAGTYWFKRPCKNGICAVVAASFAGDIVAGYK